MSERMTEGEWADLKDRFPAWLEASLRRALAEAERARASEARALEALWDLSSCDPDTTLEQVMDLAQRTLRQCAGSHLRPPAAALRSAASDSEKAQS